MRFPYTQKGKEAAKKMGKIMKEEAGKMKMQKFPSPVTGMGMMGKAVRRGAKKK